MGTWQNGLQIKELEDNVSDYIRIGHNLWTAAMGPEKSIAQANESQ